MGQGQLQQWLQHHDQQEGTQHDRIHLTTARQGDGKSERKPGSSKRDGYWSHNYEVGSEWGPLQPFLQ